MSDLAIDDQGKLHINIESMLGNRVLIQANSGGGKSWLLRLFAEGMAGHVPILIFDPEGEYVSLRERFDFALVGHDGELPIAVDSATLLARKLVEFRVSAIVNLSDFDSLEDKRSYTELFLKSLLSVPRSMWGPTIVMIDEAHRFAPKQGGDVNSLNAMITLMDAGRKRGFCGIVATQRISKIHNDVIAEANNIFIGRTWLDNDQIRAGDILGMNKDDRRTLRDLPPGEFFGFGPSLSEPGISRFRSGAVTTTHPKPESRFYMPVPKASSYITEIISQLGDIPSQAAQDADELSAAYKRIAELEKQLGEAKPGISNRSISSDQKQEGEWRKWFDDVLAIAELRGGLGFQKLRDVFRNDHRLWHANFISPLVQMRLVKSPSQGRATEIMDGWTISAMRQSIQGISEIAHPSGVCPRINRSSNLLDKQPLSSSSVPQIAPTSPPDSSPAPDWPTMT